MTKKIEKVNAPFLKPSSTFSLTKTRLCIKSDKLYDMLLPKLFIFGKQTRRVPRLVGVGLLNVCNSVAIIRKRVSFFNIHIKRIQGVCLVCPKN